MMQREFDVADARTVEVAANGDVVIAGWDGETIQVVGDADEHQDVTEERLGENLRIAIPGDAKVQIPRRMHLRIGAVGGDVSVSGIGAGLEATDTTGDLSVQDVNGDTHLGNVSGDVNVRDLRGTLRVGSVAGDLRVRGIEGTATAGTIAGDAQFERVSGDVALESQVAGDAMLASIGGAITIGSVAGDARVAGCRTATIRSVSGDVRLEDLSDRTVVDHVGGDAILDDCRGPVVLGAVGGDLRGRRLLAGLTASNVGGDTRLRTTFTPGCEYVVTCGGSATIVLAGNPATVSATFDLRCEGGRIHADLPLQDVVREEGVLRGRLGAGEATVRVQSGSRIRLASREPEPGVEGMMDNVFEGIEAGMEGAFGWFEGGRREHFERRMQEMSERISRATEDIQRRTADRIERQAQEMARRAEEMAQRAAERASERLSRQAEKAWRWGGPGWGGAWGRRAPGPPPPPPPPPPPKPRATEEERLAVLRMLAEGKISAEQAARLLEALGS